MARKIKPANQRNSGASGAEGPWHLGWNAVAAMATVVATGLAGWAGYYAFQTYESTIDTAKKELRAYLGIDKVDLEMPNLQNANYSPIENKPGALIPDWVVLTIRNSGTTPAFDAEVHVSHERVSYGHQLPLNYEFKDLPIQMSPGLELVSSKRAVFPGQTWNFRSAFNDIRPFIATRANKANVFIFGHIDYIDIYGQKHQTRFCYDYEPCGTKPEPFVAFNRHNDAD